MDYDGLARWLEDHLQNAEPDYASDDYEMMCLILVALQGASGVEVSNLVKAHEISAKYYAGLYDGRKPYTKTHLEEMFIWGALKGKRKQNAESEVSE